MADVTAALEVLEQITAGDAVVQDRIDAAIAALKSDTADVTPAAAEEPTPKSAPKHSDTSGK
jgi:hypothetical protein